MQTYYEVLEPSKTNRHAIRWTPAATARGGLLTILGKRDTTEYLVVEFTTPFDGRAFHFAKATAGTDPEAEGYDVFCGRGDNHSCTCRGFLRHGKPCKHINAALAVWDNGWLDMANPEADSAATEAPF